MAARKTSKKGGSKKKSAPGTGTRGGANKKSAKGRKKLSTGILKKAKKVIKAVVAGAAAGAAKGAVAGAAEAGGKEAGLSTEKTGQQSQKARSAPAKKR